MSEIIELKLRPPAVEDDVLQRLTDQTMEAVAHLVGTLGGQVILPVKNITLEGVDELNVVLAPAGVLATLQALTRPRSAAVVFERLVRG